MKKGFYIILLFTLIVNTGLYSQVRRFVVKPTSFSSRISDEFSPVFYKGGIVFCSNECDNSLVSYNNDKSKLYKIYYVTKKDSTGWKRPKILSKEITSDFNDGPVTFNEEENIIYYSRNNSIKNSMKNISDSTNKMGIFSAELVNGKWTNINPFLYNDQNYSLGTPSLTPDGKRI